MQFDLTAVVIEKGVAIVESIELRRIGNFYIALYSRILKCIINIDETGFTVEAELR